MVKFFDTSVKTNWEFIAIVVVFGLAVGGGVWWLLISAPFVPVTQPGRSSPSPVPIDWETYQQCGEDSNCMLVQTGWCKDVIAINRKYETEWGERDKINAEVARQNLQTCEPALSEDLNPDNFVPRCEKFQCVATKKLDVGHSLPKGDTSAWQTYHNEEFGFEVRYPEDFIDSPKGIDTILFLKKEMFDNPMTTFYGQKPELRELLIWSISIARKATLYAFCKDWIDSGYTKKNILLNGFSAARCTNINLYRPNTFVAVPKDSDLIIFTLYYDQYEYLSIFDQILSTFRFAP